MSRTRLRLTSQPLTFSFILVLAFFSTLMQSATTAFAKPAGLLRLPDSHEEVKKEVTSAIVEATSILQRKREMTSVDLITFSQTEQIKQESLTVDAASLYRAFEQVKDARGKKGKRYPLAFILTLIMLGKMAGQTKIKGIISWIKERKKEIKKMLNWPKDFPSQKAYTHALSHCDPQEIARVIAQVILKARAARQKSHEVSISIKREQNEEKLVHTAMDGKALKGTRKHEKEEQPEVYTLSLYDCETGIVVDQKAYGSRGEERSAGLAILHPALVKGRIITTDALHSYRDFCRFVHRCSGYYLTIIKNNNPAVRRDLAEFFQDEGMNRKGWQYHKTIQKGHGRLEVREIWTSTQMNNYFAHDWIGVAQVFMIRRTVKEKGEERVEIVYGITNLMRKKANAERLLELNQKHWYVENRLHYRRDVTLGEDASQVRIKGAPAVLAALNGGILALSDFLGVKNLAEQMIHYCAQPREVLQLLLGDLVSV
jgi:predicted transposase YbfD/YdcC